MNIVHNCDCMEHMKDISDNYYDLCIADPWYGIGMTKNDTTGFAKRRFRLIENNIGKTAIESFNDYAPPKKHFDEIRRISKNQIIWGGNYFLDYLGNCRAPYIWDKGTGANYFADGEMAWTSFKTGCLRIYKHRWCGFFKDSERKTKLIHPCQKPVALYIDILKRFAKPGMTIFSPYVGSGPGRIACHDLGLDFEGCEIDGNYWEAQEERYKYHILQGLLFEKDEL